MNQRMLAWTMAGAIVCGPVWADSTRLAFSKAENIEIFVEHAPGVPWCSGRPDIRVVFHGSPDMAALGRLMPKLGALLGQQCPQAAALTWHGQDGAGKAVAKGSSSKAGLWALVTQPPESDPPASDQAPAAQAGPAASVPQAQVGRSEILAPAGQKPDKDAAVAEEASAQALVAQQAAVVMPDFNVKGWKPQNEADVLAAAPFLKEMQNQNGCKIRAGFNLGTDAQYVSVITDGVECEGGRAQGKGSLTLRRSDGAVVARMNNLYFTNGYVFKHPVRTARLVGTDGKSTLWFGLGGNQALQSYFLLRARVNARQAFSTLEIDNSLDVLIAREETFRQAADITRAVNASLAVLESEPLPQARSLTMHFADSLEGLVNEDIDHMMYAINVARKWSWSKGVPVGPWQYSLDKARNYVFIREKRRAEEVRRQQQRAEQEAAQRQRQLAWEKRQELQNKARKASQQLAQYQDLVDRDQAAPGSLLKRYFVSSAKYVPVDGGQFTRFYAGRPMAFQQIVHVNGHDGSEARVDFPYDLRIANGKDLQVSWYVIVGEASADQKRRDSDGLAMTIVTPKPVGGIQVCKKEGCVDLANPLAVMRLINDMPDWTPESAQQQIDQAQAEG